LIAFYIKWKKTWPQKPLPVALPSKTLFARSSIDTEVAESRRFALQTFLMALLTAGDACWRSSEAWATFLAIPLPTPTPVRASTFEN
jgi:hypothetical protein